MHKPSLHSSRLRMIVLMLLLALLPFKAFAQLELQWIESYGGDDFDEIYDHIETSDGGFAFTGYKRTGDDYTGGVWLAKTNSDGELLWEYSHEFDSNEVYEGNDQGYTLFEQDDGGFLVIGYMGYSTDEHGWPWNDDILIFKTTADGDSIQWTKTYGGGGWEKAFKAIHTDDGGYALAGVTTSWGAGQEDFFLLKLDENCDSLWMKTYGDDGVDICYELIQTSDGGYALVGSTTMIRNSPSAYWALFVNENGDSLRSFTAGYDQSAQCKCISVEEIENENFIISGGFENSGHNNGHGLIWTLGLNSEARRLWSRVDESDNQYSNQKGYASCLLSDTSVAITGFYNLSREFGNPEGKLWILEVTASGEGRYIFDEGWGLLNYGQSITRTSTNELCVAGYAGRDRETDGYIFKTSELPNSVGAYSDNTINDAILISAYPNPFNSQTTFILNGPEIRKSYNLKLLDIGGRLVWLSKISYNKPVIWKPVGLPSGTYLVTVQVGDLLLERNLLLLK